MRIAEITARPVRIPRDLQVGTGTAGSPTALQAGSERYRWSAAYPCLYPVDMETALVRVRLDDGTEGWGEAQAPVAPEVACSIVEHILSRTIAGEEFEPTRDRIRQLYWRMYAAMRVRGQTGGFMLDAIAGVDLALWDIAGKLGRTPVSQIIRNGACSRVPMYLSGLPGGTLEGAKPWIDSGCQRLKVYLASSEDDALRTIDAVPAGLQIGLDALWRLEPESAPQFAQKLEQRRIWFLECPFYPELIDAHMELRSCSLVPVALGESYRTTFELRPFFNGRLMDIVQPDLGRTGITGALAIAEQAELHGMQVIPHVSLALGPQIAAAIHFAAAAGSPCLEFNPTVVDVANRYLRSPIRVEDAVWQVPEAAGLGIDLTETP